MPPLRWFGRNWMTASDDFVCSSFIYFAFNVAGGVLALVRTKQVSIKGCPDASLLFSRSFFALGCVDIITAAAFIITGALSMRGGVFEKSKRLFVPIFLYFDLACLVTALVLDAILTHEALTAGGISHCTIALDRHIIRAVIAINYISPIIFILIMCISFDPYGGRSLRTVDDYESMCSSRMRLMCCECGGAESSDDPFDSVSRTLAILFRGYDVVPSDIAAGLILLYGYEERSRRLSVQKLSYGEPPEGCVETIDSDACHFPPLTPQQVDQFCDAEYYSKYYLGAYGWLLYEYAHWFTGIPTLCCKDPFACCRNHPGYNAGTSCFCDARAARILTGVDEEDILMGRWESTLFHPVFYVAVDRSKQSVVIAVRGTLSLVDCVVDLVAQPEPIHLDDVPAVNGNEPFAHGGMLRCAENVLADIQSQGILERILTGDLSTLKVVVLGHSLGGGTSSIMSILMWSRYRALRGRMNCIAYAPPGGLLSKGAVEYAKQFTVGCFLRDDVVPRIAHHTTSAFREQLLDVLAHSATPKTMIFLNCVRAEEMVKHIHPSSEKRRTPKRESNSRRLKLNDTPCSPKDPERLMYPGGTMIHIRKAVELRRGGCSCSSEEVFVPTFIGYEDVQFVPCSTTMLTDHMPDKMYNIMKVVREQLLNGELDRFFSDTPPSTPTSQYSSQDSYDSYGSKSQDSISVQ